MKVKSKKSSRIMSIGLMAVLGCLSNQSMAGCQISISSMAGNWSYYEQGKHVTLGSWSELGSFTLNRLGKGSGTAIITAAEANIVNVQVPLNPIQVTSYDINTCIGTANFTVGQDVRTITFTVISNMAFDYLSTVGDLTIIGHATKRPN